MRMSFLDVVMRSSLFVSAGTALNATNSANNIGLQIVLVGTGICLLATLLILSIDGWTIKKKVNKKSPDQSAN